MDLKQPSHFQERYIKSHYAREYEKIKSLPGRSWKEQLYMYINGLISIPTCPICGKRLNFKNSTEGYAQYCVGCVAKSDIVKKKRSATCIKQYGVSHYTNREKFKRTCEEKYGVSNPNNLIEVREKISNTNKSRYGGIGFAAPILNEKAKRTCEEKYGTENFQQSCLLETYPELISFNGTDWICSCPHPGCNVCADQQYHTTQRTHYTRKNEGIELCTNILPVRTLDTKSTSIELFMRNILDKHNIKHIDNTYDIITPKELDIYCPDYKIAIEVNGTRWHSDKFHPAKSCLHKHQLCESIGIQLITIWEDQINRIPQIIESMILSKFGIFQNRIGARQCRLQHIDGKIAQEFIQQNHIQGRTTANKHIGAFYNDELVGVMTFIKSRGCQGSKIKSDGEWELNRFCTKLGWQIIGLTSKMLKFFIKNESPHTIISFSHNDISTGNVYSKLGFIKSGSANTSYYYILHNKRYHRSNFTRAGIVRKWPEYDINDKTWTERGVMDLKGYYRIYDCGTQKWVLDPKS